MNRKEYLLTCLAEEASEIVKAVTKTLRFGESSVYNNVTNKKRLEEEIIDFITIVSMCYSDEYINFDEEELKIQFKLKQDKIFKYMELSKNSGNLT